MIDLDRIDEYCRRATKAPWQTRFIYRLFRAARESVIVLMHDGPDKDWPNADFIAQARTDLPAVVAELREAREVLREGQELMAILHPDSSDKPLEAGCIYNEWLSKVRKFLGVAE